MTRLPIMLLGAVLLVTLSGRKAQAQVSEQDSLALVALYNATDGHDPSRSRLPRRCLE